MIYDADLYDALLLRFPRDEYVVLQEVSTVDGARRADAIAIALWASRGQEMHGFEVKASRSDWLRELKEPAKAEAMFNLCDRWWLLVTDESIVKDGELPAGWGMLVLKGKQLRTVVKAPPLEPRMRPWSFVVRLLRKSHEEAKLVEERLTTSVRDKAYDEVRASVEKQHEDHLARLKSKYEEKLRRLEEFETAIGETLHDWTLPRIRKALALERNGLDERLRDLQRLRDRIDDVLKSEPAPAAEDEAA
jgi:hypothetical protein